MPIKLTRTDNVGEIVRVAMLAPKIKKVAEAFKKSGFDLPGEFVSDLVVCLARMYDLDNPVGGLDAGSVQSIEDELFKVMLSDRGRKVLDALHGTVSPEVLKPKLVEILKTGMDAILGRMSPLETGEVPLDVKQTIADKVANDVVMAYEQSNIPRGAGLRTAL